MNLAISFWVDSILKVITAMAATAVAFYVALISKRQWETNQEKLRLDLYQRRFEIYLRVLDYYWALLEWRGKPEQLVTRGPFVKAFCESKFMFPEKSGVYDFLKEFNEHAFRITNFKSSIDELGDVFPNETVKLAQQRSKDVNWILMSVDTLLARMAPFLNFHKL
jgi:hypothetical protein